MMDFALDGKQSKALQCDTCDPGKMKIRNCNNLFGKSQSPILVNGNIYRQCPRSLVTDSWEVGYIVSLYFDCKENKVYPYGKSMLQMTSFCKEAFDLMDSIVSDFRERSNKKREEELDRERKKVKTKSKSKKG